MTSPRAGARGRSNPLHAGLILLNLVLLLFPPISWVMARGNIATALLFSIGLPLVLVISMFVLIATERDRGALK